MSAEDLRAVMAACPALLYLHLCNAVASSDLTPLLQLPSTVISLTVKGCALNDDSAATIAQLTHLELLNWDYSPDLTDAGLEHLTALRRLKHQNMFSNDGLRPELLDDRLTLEEGGCGTLCVPHNRTHESEVGYQDGLRRQRYAKLELTDASCLSAPGFACAHRH